MAKRPEQIRLEAVCGGVIFDDFMVYQARFKEITLRAGGCFLLQDWLQVRADASARLALYDNVLSQTVSAIEKLLAGELEDKKRWADMRRVYADKIKDQENRVLAETYFNSVTRRIFSTVGVDPEIEFIDSDYDALGPLSQEPIYTRYGRASSTEQLFKNKLSDYKAELPLQNLVRDARRIAERVSIHLKQIGALRVVERVEMVQDVFYRGMEAYLVGRVYSGSHVIPLALALLHEEKGIYVDMVLLTEEDTSILFSFTRSYFHVKVERPFELVRFLKTLLPLKRTAELYNAIGYDRHGKTELFRDLKEQLAYCCGDQFEMARGKRGMVMEVFTMPSYDIVFKIIKDRFGAPKRVSREHVIDKYDLVFNHDRAGRLVEAQSFEFLNIERCGFSDALLEELQRSASKTFLVADDQVILTHVYVERRVTPLDIYLQEADKESAHSAVIDFGNCIKDLAKSNIFPGDFLLKNFGVTRHGRVVFYDYDEICFLTECRFRKLPKAKTHEDEFSGEPWFLVEEADVFPETFRQFVGLANELMAEFLTYHEDLFSVEFWIRAQQSIQDDQFPHILPYDDQRRLGAASKANPTIA
jgi:isocitrate dehydrogenase kinase/phosphatase